MNENYVHPPMPQGAQEGILKGMYLLREGPGEKGGQKVQLLGSGAILREVIAAADLLESDFGVSADIWSVTSFTELRREGLDVSAGTCCIRRKRPGRASSRRACAIARARSSRPPTT